MGGGGARGGDGRREPQEQNVHIATEGAERGRDRRAVHAIEAAGGRLQSGIREGGAGDVPERLEVPIRADGRDTGGGRAELRRPRERGAPDEGEQCQRRRPAGGRGVYRVPAGLRVEEQSELSRSCGGYQDEGGPRVRGLRGVPVPAQEAPERPRGQQGGLPVQNEEAETRGGRDMSPAPRRTRTFCFRVVEL